LFPPPRFRFFSVSCTHSAELRRRGRSTTSGVSRPCPQIAVPLARRHGSPNQVEILPLTLIRCRVKGITFHLLTCFHLHIASSLPECRREFLSPLFSIFLESITPEGVHSVHCPRRLGRSLPSANCLFLYSPFVPVSSEPGPR